MSKEIVKKKYSEREREFVFAKNCNYQLGRTPFRSLSTPLYQRSHAEIWWIWNSKRSLATAEIAIYFFITAAFALSYDSAHHFAGKGVLTDLNGVLPMW